MIKARFFVSFALAKGLIGPAMAHAGTSTTLYTFFGTADSGTPVGPLVYQNGIIFGVTYGVLDTPPSNGIVSQLDTKTHALKVLHKFEGRPDGSVPSDLIQHNDMLYGTTNAGGVPGYNGSGCGTVFAVDKNSHSESVLYKFPDRGHINSADPGGLVYNNGMLYGTTYSGGTGAGSVFSINL